MPDTQNEHNELTQQAEAEVLDITRRMLDAMYSGDAGVHRAHSAEDMSSYEWYIAPQRIDGAQFHLRLIEAGGNGTLGTWEMLTPRVQVYGDTAIVCYTLLKTASSGEAGQPARFSTMNETRVFVKISGVWRMVHLHKSPT